MKKKTLITLISVVLVLALAIGGTFAFLRDETEVITNKFQDNKVNVALTETKGQAYNIVPGTSQDKDPTVTVTTTLPSYVFVVVTDATEGRVSFSIADGWTELVGAPNLEANQKLYWRETPADDPTASPVPAYPYGGEKTYTYSVLEGDKVTYPSTLENAETLDQKALSFKAYAIQKAPFDDPLLAWRQEVPTRVDDADSLADAVEAGGLVLLTENIVTDESVVIPANTTAVIDLAGHELAITSDSGEDGLVISDGATVTLTDSSANNAGVYKFTGNNSQNDAIFVYNEDATKTTTLNIEDVVVEIDAESKNWIAAYAEAGKAEFNINDGAVINVFGENVQAAGVEARDNSVVNMNGGTINVKVTGTNSSLDAVGILVWGPNSEVNISDGEINVVGGGTFAQGVQIGDKYQDGSSVVKMTGGKINVSGKDACAFAIARAFASFDVTGGEINVAVDAGSEGLAFCFQYGNDAYGVVNLKDGIVKLTGENNLLTDAPARVAVA